ncbi:MAG: YiiD C-terminal domain-containing protein [Longimicrobiales bacterium]|nr:YiiD C-terminal domain-containing protein [Longimicrobiales bacterium]
MTADELRSYLYREIPLSRAMEMDVVEPGPGRVVLSAPLEPNTNHRSTAFGGSVTALATLAGWVAVHSRLREEGRKAQVVIQRGTMEYLLPVTRPFRAVCSAVDDDEWRRLRRTLDRSGKGRARLDVHIEVDGGTVGRFEGTYVAIEPR